MRRRGLLGGVMGVSVGLAMGVGLYTFSYARGASYLSNDPKACLNCHVMREQYDGWSHSSHKAVATCNDCHTPHDVIGKYITKARNGWHHSVAFTSGKFHEPIRIGPRNAAITQENCRRCHGDIVDAIDSTHGGADEQLDCARCHRNVGHLH